MIAAGLALVGLVALLVVEAVAYSRGGMLSDFWARPLDDKLDHIAAHRGAWRTMGIVWMAMLAVVAGGMVGLAAILDETLGWVALGVFLVGVAAWLVGVTLQAAGVAVAAAERVDTGSTPGWVHPLWAVGWMCELSWVIAANAASIGFGIAIVGGDVLAAWAGWVAIVAGGHLAIGVAITRYAFPQMGLLVPIVLGVALLIAA
jgi:hypothetical protein